MSFNYGREKRKFDQEWERLQAEYEAAGMDEASIQEMKQYDWKWFCSQRVYNDRARPLPSECVQEAAGPSAPLQKCDGVSGRFYTDGGFQSRYGWILDVEDEGLSQRLQKLAPEDLERIWERFYRADPSRTGEGTGLGLPMVKWIVQLHGGKIAVESRPGAGPAAIGRLLPGCHLRRER